MPIEPVGGSSSVTVRTFDNPVGQDCPEVQVVFLAALGDEQLTAEERRERRHRVERARRALHAHDLGGAAVRVQDLEQVRESRSSGTRSSPWTSGQNGSATDAGLRSVSTATHWSRVAASIASMNGPIASMS